MMIFFQKKVERECQKCAIELKKSIIEYVYIYVAKIWDYALLFNGRFWKQKCS